MWVKTSYGTSAIVSAIAYYSLNGYRRATWGRSGQSRFEGTLRSARGAEIGIALGASWKIGAYLSTFVNQPKKITSPHHLHVFLLHFQLRNVALVSVVPFPLSSQRGVAIDA